MSTLRHVEIFSAGCPVCEDTITLVNQLACPSCEISVLDMKDQAVARRAKKLGIRTIPAILIDGQIAECCAERGPSERLLRAAGMGTSKGKGTDRTNKTRCAERNGEFLMRLGPKMTSTIRCPLFGFQKTESMPIDSCRIMYECQKCRAILRPKTGDCCVFCSYGAASCPPRQANHLGA